MKSIEVQLNEALELVKAKDAEIVTLKEAVNKHQVATAKAERTSQLKESKLPEPCVKRIDEAFSKSTDNAGLKEAVNVEDAYIKSLRTTVKHNGSEDNGGTITEANAKMSEMQESQFNSCVASGMTVTEASVFSGFKPKK